MRWSVTGIVFLILTTQAGCRGGFGRTDDELSPCWPSCPPGHGEPMQLVLEFATPHALSWSWDADAPGPDVSGYMLWFGVNREEVRNRTGAADVWDVYDDANLGWGFSPFGPNRVHRTTIRDLSPGATTAVELWAFFTVDDARVIAEGEATTPREPTGRIVIFEDTQPAGSLQGFEGATTERARSGTKSLYLGGTGAWVDATLMDIDVDLNGLSGQSWDEAYVEFFILVEEAQNRTPPVYYMELYMGSSGIEAPFVYSYPSYVALPSRTDWHRIQVPLSTLAKDGIPMSEADFGTTLQRFGIGFVPPPERTVYVDDISIRY